VATGERVREVDDARTRQRAPLVVHAVTFSESTRSGKSECARV
jgi:hypothetical protein